MYRLHCFSQSGNAYKVGLTLRLLDQPFEAVHLPFAEFLGGATRDAGWRERVNEMGEVPVLELEDGRRLTQSGAIMSLLADRHGRLGGADADERYEVLRWLLFDNHKFTSYFSTLRFMKSFAPQPAAPAVAAFLLTRVRNAFGVVERHLQGREFLVGAAPTIADLSLCGYLYYPVEESGIDVAADYPQIGAWLARLRALPDWAGPYELLPGERVAPKW
ncbi:glutathione S-transferase family protein [Roseateles violae]|uniref:Glutathione S-transferase family protein n=1 Tax=Roseateles violae TaxID=3058042 RepID=A0ABT8DMT0_9BURK|nr:glutathione S-transferase family protein [Pelomonas sp. PFR6]MDN3919296.1 glutathione S-transferase family protein [Pelomonas sp. PFR6]